MKRQLSCTKVLKTFILLWCALGVMAPFCGWAQKPDSSLYRPEEIEWTWEVRPQSINPALPNVLLVGDSITRNYFPAVRQELADAANVYLFSSSISVGDPRLERELAEFVRMEGVKFSVVHFNNGLHGWKYTEEEYARAFPRYLKAVRGLSPRARLIWTSSTPMKKAPTPEASNERVAARNEIALKYAIRAGIPVDDQYALMQKHQDLYQDNVHFNEAGAEIQGGQAAQMIRNYLK